MKKNTLTLNVLKDICEQWTLNDVMEKEQNLLDKIKTDLNVDLKTIGYKNDLQKIEILSM